ncbi:hypothetical protein HYW31_01330 [Candidatus Berkelbacteria bacterium]|nr:hypothetical protein [Candidatus Berkelbacteria bacterium]
MPTKPAIKQGESMDEKEIIYLEGDTEISEVVEKLRQHEKKPLMLVVPKGALLLQSIVNLKILKNEAAKNQLTLALVTTDKVGQHLASQVGVPVYEDLKAPHPTFVPEKIPPPVEETIELDLTAREKDEEPEVPVHHYQISTQKPLEAEPPSRPLIKPKRSKKRLIFVFILFLIMALAVILFVPSAKITLAIKSEPLDEKLQIRVDTQVSDNDFSTALLKGKAVEKELEKDSEFKTTGKKEVGEKAKGTLTVTNETGVDQVINEGTEFKENDSGLVFTNTTTVIVPKATLNAAGDKVSGTIKTEVAAKEGGSKYNLAVSNYSVNSLDKITAKGGPMTGGTTREVAILTKTDQDNVSQTLFDELVSQLHQEIADTEKNARVLEGAFESKIEFKEFDQKENAETSKFKLKMKVKTKGIVFEEDIYRRLIVFLMEQKLPNNKMLVLSEQDEVATQVAGLDLEKGELKLEGAVKTKMASKLDAAAIKKNLKAKSKDKAKEYLFSLGELSSFEIIAFPGNLKRLPLLSARIKLEIKTE